MSSIFTCDRCHKEFGGPLDQESYNEITYDLCFPCRKKLQDEIEEVKKNFFEGVING